MNEALRQAMVAATMTEAQLAAACRVDPKTVGRWLADPTRVPHGKHRWAACQALGVEEAVLWPTAVRSTVKVGPDREIVAVFPYRSAAPASLWRQLIGRAESQLTFAGYTNYFLWLEQANLGGLLRRKAATGCRVRFLIGDPGSPVTRQREIDEDVPLTLSTRIAVTIGELQKLQDVDSIEGRFSSGHIALSVFRFDDEMIVTPLLPGRVGHDAPMLHLRRLQDDGLFDRYAQCVEELWGRGRPVWDLEVQHAEA